MATQHKLYFAGGTVLHNGSLVEAPVYIEEGVIAAIGESKPSSATEVNTCGLSLLPGMIDVHGDAFERQLSPRPGVRFPFRVAMADTDRQLAANGITTAYHGLTLSWEPGLRSIESGIEFLQHFEAIAAAFSVDHRIQLRWETFALEGVDLVKSWLDHPSRPSLAFNDHTTSMLARFSAGDISKKASEWASRAGITTEEYVAMVRTMGERQDGVPQAINALATLGQSKQVPMLSHDDRGKKDRGHFRALGASVAEFPLTEEAAIDARTHKEHVVLGAPNVVRGGSHVGAMGAEDAVSRGLCTVLASDYYYPAMASAVERLTQAHTLADIWPTVSSNPAESMGLNDRGHIDIGLRADLVLTKLDDGVLQLVSTYCAGQPVWQGQRAPH